LPAPLGPIIAKRDFSLMSNETSVKALTPPKLRFTLLKLINEFMRATFFYVCSV